MGWLSNLFSSKQAVKVDFAQLTPVQRSRVLLHLQEYRDNPELLDPEDDENRACLGRLRGMIESGATLRDASDLNMLAVFVANTSDVEDGEPFCAYVREALGLPQLLD